MINTNRIGCRTLPTVLALREKFLAVLDKEQSKRRQPGNDEWLQNELEALLRAMNWERANLDLDPIPLRKLLRVETTASGHCDYTRKLALYAAELVLLNESVTP